MALATLSDLKAYLGITDSSSDTILTLLLNSAEATIKTRTGREFDADSANRTEIKNGNAQLSIMADKYPIISVASLKYNTGTISTPTWELIEADCYSIDTPTGIINLLSPSVRGFQKYQLIYKWGYSTIPWDLQMACIKIAASNYNRRNSDGIKSETVNGDRLEFSVSEVPDDVETILSNYRKPYV